MYVTHQLKVLPLLKKKIRAVSQMPDRKIELDSQSRTQNWETSVPSILEESKSPG